ncbi:MAG: glycoside hydrolase family 3 N-terminal domain-containing protein [Pseudomonadota bacterium]
MTAPVIFGCEGLEISEFEKAFFREMAPWGFILFRRNLAGADQITRLCSELRASVGWRAPIFIDQEGGRVARLTAPLAHEFLPALDMVEALGPDPQTQRRGMWIRARVIADDLTKLGIDGNCAPLGDIAYADTHAVIKNRCYGQTAAQVANNARAVAEATLAGGVLPVLKHMPGHGRAMLDSHKDLPIVEGELKDLKLSDFDAFSQLRDLPLGMTAHVVFPSLDPEHPVTQSPKAIDYLRRELGFDGLLMTDDLSMEALNGTPKARAEASLGAGVDLVLHCNGKPHEMLNVAEGIGTLAGPALKRVEAAEALRTAPEVIDIPALEAELEALISTG